MDTRPKAILCEYAQRLHERGWVANHEGNATLRLGPGRFAATPTATSKARVTADTLLIVDEEGRPAGGSAAAGKPFSEIGLHLAVYAARPDVHAVLHAHPPMATAFAVAGVALDRPLLAEAVVSLGESIPLVPFAQPGPLAASALRPYLADCDVCLLESHGVLAWGEDLEQAYLRMEQVEHLATIAYYARHLGGAKELPASALPALRQAREKAFGRPAPEPTPAVPPSARTLPAPDTDLTRIIREELARALRR